MGCTGSKPDATAGGGEATKPTAQSTGYTAGPGAGTSTVTSATQTAKPSGSAGASYNGVAAQKGSGIGGNTYADQGQAVGATDYSQYTAPATSAGPGTPGGYGSAGMGSGGSGSLGGVARPRSPGSPKPVTRPRWNSTPAAAAAQARKTGSPAPSQAAVTPPRRRTAPDAHSDHQQPFEPRTMPSFMSPTRSSSSKLREPTASPAGPQGKKRWGVNAAKLTGGGGASSTGTMTPPQLRNNSMQAPGAPAPAPTYAETPAEAPTCAEPPAEIVAPAAEDEAPAADVGTTATDASPYAALAEEEEFGAVDAPTEATGDYKEGGGYLAEAAASVAPADATVVSEKAPEEVASVTADAPAMPEAASVPSTGANTSIINEAETVAAQAKKFSPTNEIQAA